MARTKKRDLVVYMYLNTVTEMVYVGSSLYGLEHRHRSHMKNVQLLQKEGKHASRFYRALTEWALELWDRIVLERCQTEEELDTAERRWMNECHALEDGVGYNTYDARYLRSAIAGGAAMKAKRVTPEERLRLKAIGVKGQLTRRANGEKTRLERKLEWASKTPKEKRAYLSECGKRGAFASKLKRLENR